MPPSTTRPPLDSLARVQTSDGWHERASRHRTFGRSLRDSGQRQPVATSQHFFCQPLLVWLTSRGVEVQHIAADHPRDVDVRLGGRVLRLFDHAEGPTAVDWEIVAQPPENAGQVGVGLQVAVHRPRPERLIATLVDEDNEVPAVAHSDQVPFVNAVNLHVRQSRPRPGGNFLAHRLRTSPHADSRGMTHRSAHAHSGLGMASHPDRGMPPVGDRPRLSL